MPRSIAIVFADDFSVELEKLSFHTPVWLVDSPANHDAAERAWQNAIEWPHISVTLFRSPAQIGPDDWRSLIHQIALRERTTDTIDVFGAPLTLVARSVLGEAGYARFEDTAGGFRARR